MRISDGYWILNYLVHFLKINKLLNLQNTFLCKENVLQQIKTYYSINGKNEFWILSGVFCLTALGYDTMVKLS